MGNKRLAIGGVALAALAVAVAPALADSSPFTGPGVVASCGGPLLGTGNATIDQATTTGAFGVGSACFTVPTTTTPGPNAVTANAVDSSGAPVAYAVQYQAADGTNSTVTNDGCNGQQTFSFPTDIQVAYVYVFVDDPLTAKVACGAPSAATSGTLSATWVYPTP